MRFPHLLNPHLAIFAAQLPSIQRIILEPLGGVALGLLLPV